MFTIVIAEASHAVVSRGTRITSSHKRSREEVIRVPLKTTAPGAIIAGAHDKIPYKYLYFAFKETSYEPGISLVVRVKI